MNTLLTRAELVFWECLMNGESLNHVTTDWDAKAVWSKSIDVLKDHLDPQIFSAWIKPLTISRLDITEEASHDSQSASTLPELELRAPNKFCCDHVERNYGGLIASTLSRVAGLENVKLSFRVGDSPRLSVESVSPVERVVAPDSVAGTAEAIVHKSIRSATQLSTRTQPKIQRLRFAGTDSSNLHPKYNFSNYVVGDCNQFAHAVSLRVSQHLGTAYNPLFLYGGVGLGKTHLANAIGNTARRLGKNVLLVSSEIFVNELIAALRSNRMQQFKTKFRSLDLLIVDDIQFLIGKERTQEEFFHTFNDLYNRHRQIIVTSDKTPQELIGLEERLRTRFSSGLSADLQAPDFETRVAILTKKAEAGGISLTENVARLLAEKIDTNVRELEGALNRLHAMSSLHQTPITPAFVADALKTLIPENTREITSELIQKTVAERYNVGLSDLLGKRRTQNIAFARHVAMYFCRRLTARSFPEIGAIFGGRDHSTVIHANRVITERAKSDESLRLDLGALEKKLQG